MAAIDPAGLLVAILAASPGLAALYSSRNSRKEGQAKAEVAAFELAKEFYEKTLQGYKDELQSKRDELKLTKDSLAKEKTDKQFLEIRVGELERRIRILEIRLKESGIPIEGPEQKE